MEDDLLRWGLGCLGMFILFVIAWDHKTTKREEKARKAKEAEENEWYWF